MGRNLKKEERISKESDRKIKRGAMPLFSIIYNNTPFCVSSSLNQKKRKTQFILNDLIKIGCIIHTSYAQNNTLGFYAKMFFSDFYKCRKSFWNGKGFCGKYFVC
ncbi:hypothetical protein D0T49_04305 [Paludibacter sp. 221]|uniref:hypothetical protein n=1 Tax=Paludibacter sp. 221 TaxID=2302939 RepID=UPI0013D0A299|nr:hypothetical protein [Paludibacter sp. 221]NDV46262.1 hypothetical protein [Paludibacter sp. 221]